METGRRAEQGGRADPHGGDPRCVVEVAPQRHVRPVQGQSPAPARRSDPAIPADPRRHPGILDPVHRGGRAGGGRYHRLLRHRGGQAGLEGDDCQQRQGSDAADRRRWPGRHARHDERPADRTRPGDREIRGSARVGRRRAGADGRQRRQCAGDPRDRAQDRDQADPGSWDARRRACGGTGDEAIKNEPKPDRSGRHGAVVARACASGVRASAARTAGGSGADRDPARAATRFS